DAGVLRAGGTPRVFDEVYAPSTLGIFLREFTFGHALTSSPRWPARIWWRSHSAPRCWPGIEQRAFVDIDSLLRPVYGHRKQGASFGHAKIATPPPGPRPAAVALRAAQNGGLPRGLDRRARVPASVSLVVSPYDLLPRRGICVNHHRSGTISSGRTARPL